MAGLQAPGRRPCLSPTPQAFRQGVLPRCECRPAFGDDSAERVRPRGGEVISIAESIAPADSPNSVTFLWIAAKLRDIVAYPLKGGGVWSINP